MNKALGTLQFQLYEYDTKLQDSDANPLPGRLLLGVQLWVALHANSILSAVSAAVESVNKSFIMSMAPTNTTTTPMLLV
jgi:hypothetical protein